MNFNKKGIWKCLPPPQKQSYKGPFSVIIPDGVTEIEDSAFFECKNLISVVIPDSVTEIEAGAFQNCENLTKVVIPDSVTEIGDFAFCGCKNLKDIQASLKWIKEIKRQINS